MVTDMRTGIKIAVGTFALLLISMCAILGISLKNAKADIDVLTSKIDSLENIDSQQYNTLDQEYEKAQSEWSGNTAEYVVLTVSFAELWKDEMDKYYHLLYNELNDEKRHWLVSSQEKWEIYTKENEELAWQTYEQIFNTGSMMKIYEANIYLEKYRSRALTLISLYDSLTDPFGFSQES